MHVIESIGPLLGIAAFLGLAVLAFLLFQQARDVRRLREWAGRAPERAQEAADAVQTASEASRADPTGAERAAERPPTIADRLGGALGSAAGRVGSWLRAVDRHMPVDGRYLLAVLAVAVAVVAVATSGFGLVGGDDGSRDHQARIRQADGRGSERDLGDRPRRRRGQKGDRARRLQDGKDHQRGIELREHGGDVRRRRSGPGQGAVEGDQAEARRDAGAGMTPDVKGRAGGAPLALALGLDDAGFGSG